LSQGLSIAVVGGGIGGLTAALCLARQGHQVHLLEQASTFSETGAGIQLSPNATKVLLQLGLGAALAQICVRPEATHIRSWRSGRKISQTPLGDDALARYGAPYYHAHRGDLIKLLASAVHREPKIDTHLGIRFEGFAQSDDHVALTASGQRLQCDALIGADGIHSIVRTKLWGDQPADFTGNMAWRMLVPIDGLSEELATPRATVWWGPGKHFVHYLVSGGRYMNCVCVVETDTWHSESWTEPGSAAELRDDFAGWHEDIQTLLGAVDESTLFKWGLFDRPPMDAWSERRVTLLGDACHPTLPFMAQGAAMAIEDAVILANCLTGQVDVTEALFRYAQLRRSRTARVQQGSRRNARVFHLSGIQAWFRDRAASRAGRHAMDGLYRYDPLTVGLGSQ
jgi:salicylate hydroxylase